MPESFAPILPSPPSRAHCNGVYRGFNHSVQGHSHIKSGLKCQDSSGYFADMRFAIAAVSDGHGGSRHFRSDVGAKLAVDCALSQVEDFIRSIGVGAQVLEGYGASLRQLEQNIIYTWRNLVTTHIEKNPLTGEELQFCLQKSLSLENPAVFYGATLLFAAMTQNYAFAVQIGDGACVFLDGGDRECLPVPEDDRLFGNFTTSLCDANAIESFRHHFSNTLPAAIFLATDGVVNSYAEETFLKFNREILIHLQKDPILTEQELAHWLPQLSERGSGDDMSVAGVYLALQECIPTPEKLTE